MLTAIVFCVAIVCMAFICYLQHKEIKYLVDILSTRNPDSVIFNEEPSKKPRKDPFRKREQKENVIIEQE